jgi:hypothetical protein
MKEQYIAEINKLLPHADIDLLDFVFQLLSKSVEATVTPSEAHQQSA